MLTAILLAMCVLPRDIALRETVQTVEVNEFIDENGRTVFHQNIFYGSDDNVQAWRLIKEPSHLPQKDWDTRLYTVTWVDGEVLRTVYARSCVESWEQYDRELAARERLPKEKRKGLRSFPAKRKITEHGSANYRAPEHLQPIKEVAMSDNESSCAATVLKSGTVEYRDIADFPGYRIGSDGTILTCRNTSQGMTDTWKVIKGSPSGKKGYLMASLRRDGRGHRRLIHILVLEAFVGPRPPGNVGRHLDDIETDNRLLNLSWGTPAQNYADRDRNGKTARGERSGTSRLTEAQVVAMRVMSANGMSNIELAEIFKCNDRNVAAITLGKAWSHAGGPIRQPRTSDRENLPVEARRPLSRAGK